MPASASSLYGDENPFVEAMLRMMEIFGLIDRNRLPLGVPYLPGHTQLPATGLGGLSGFGGMPGMSGVPGMSSLYGMGAAPGLGGFPGGGFPGGGFPGSGMPGMGGIPGMSGVPGLGQWQGLSTWPGGGLPGYPNNPMWYGQGAGQPAVNALDGVWELDKGGFVIIRGTTARLYLSRTQFQDFTIGYDRRQLWWAPRAGGNSARYRYQVQDGRMILRDNDGSYLLLRRRR